MKGLVLDGGGVFGIGQALILAQSTDELSKFDFIAGTSIGAALAMALALDPANAAIGPDFFNGRMPKIFEGHKWRGWKPTTPKYPDKELNKALQILLPGSFSSVQTPVFITAANLGAERLKVFYSGDPDFGSWPAWEIVRAAVAAETYFSPWKGYADGGIFANNPSMVAIAGAVSKLGAKIEDLEIFSLGTGQSTTSKKVPGAGFTKVRWAMWIFDALLRGAASSMHEYFARSMPINKYQRIQFLRRQGWAMDNPDNMVDAVKDWSDQILNAVKELKAF